MKYLKSTFKNVFHFIISSLIKFEIGVKFLDTIVSIVLSKFKVIRHKDTELLFSTPNLLNHYRVKTFSIKEPETLEWIDEFEENAVLWDIGANVGLYSCYAAKRKCMVYAFEPSVFNLEVLARNINLNSLNDRIYIVPLPLNYKLGFNKLTMTSTSWGGAISSFGESYGPDGKQLRNIFEYLILGISMDDSDRYLNIPVPDYIKMDVDGIEHLILLGGSGILSKVKSILVEVDDSFKKQVNETNQLLLNAGLFLKYKKRSILFDNTTVYNQIWIRK